MAIDRFGNVVRVGWSEAEVLWVKAALTLDVADRVAAFHDIADIRGCQVGQVRHKAVEIKRQMAVEAAAAEAAAQSKVITLPPRSMFISAPTKAQLMGGRG